MVHEAAIRGGPRRIKLSPANSGNVARGCPARKNYLLSRVRLALVDHVHWTVGCGIDESPLEAGLGYLNNLAYAQGMRPVFQFGFYVGTFGPYDMNAVRRKRLADESSSRRGEPGGDAAAETGGGVLGPANRRPAGACRAEARDSRPCCSRPLVAPPGLPGGGERLEPWLLRSYRCIRSIARYRIHNCIHMVASYWWDISQIFQDFLVLHAAQFRIAY